MLQARSKSVYMSFLMCTHEDEVVEHYNKCVDPIWGCDITDDYVSERKECERNGNKLSQYKWMAKSVLGGKMGHKYDALDEKKVPATGETEVVFPLSQQDCVAISADLNAPMDPRIAQAVPAEEWTARLTEFNDMFLTVMEEGPEMARKWHTLV